MMRYKAKKPNERMSRQAIEVLNGVIDDVKHGDMIHAFNRQHITDGICPTLTTRPEGFKTASLVVEDINEKESDIMTNRHRYYDADEQTEAEEWATEIAIRIKEGNLDPIPSKKDKRLEQYDFTYVSLFSGIGGFEQALNKLGGTCVFASEFDKFAQQSYTALYGDDHLHGDITKIDEKDVPEHDLLVGGFPCQAFSVAGQRKGFEDTRGTLFFDIARIAAEKKPKALLLENVKGLVNHDKGRTLDTMIETLNDIGYIVDFDVLNSKYFGVPQNRERIFIVAVRSDLIEAEPFSEDSTTGQTIVPRGKRRIGEWAKTFNFDFPEQSEVITRLRDILESEVDEKYYLDEEKTATLVAQLEGVAYEGEINNQQGFGTTPEDISYCLTTRYDNGFLPSMFKRKERTAVIEPKIAEDQDRHGVALGEKPRYRIRKLTPLECFRLQGFPDSAHQALVDAGISDSQRYKQAGNAVTVNAIEAIGKRLIPFLNGR